MEKIPIEFLLDIDVGIYQSEANNKSSRFTHVFSIFSASRLQFISIDDGRAYGTRSIKLYNFTGLRALEEQNESMMLDVGCWNKDCL